MSTLYSSVAFGELKGQNLASIVEVDFSPENTLIVKAKNTYVKDSFPANSMNTCESVIEVGGTIIVSF